MNWETAKSWLIVAFLILDVVLGWQITQTRHEIQSYTESAADLLANTKTLLAEHGFSLAAEVPQFPADMPTFQGQFEAVPLASLAKVAFPDGNSVVDAGTSTAINPRGTVSMIRPGLWRVEYQPALTVNPADATTLTRLVWQGASYQPDPAGGGASADYLQTYKGSPIFDAALHFQATGTQLKGYTQSAVANIQPGADKPIISALDALSSLANLVDKSGQLSDNRISRIDVGYVGRTAISTDSTSPSTATYWFPVWRIVTPAQTYYINAFTGELEQMMSPSR